MSKRPLVMDVDTGVDDAMAIALSTHLTTHELVAVTTVAGNVPVEVGTLNTLRVLDWLGVDVPVYRGMDAPLARPLWTAQEFHGEDGLGGWAEPVARRTVESMSAPEAIIQLARRHRGDIAFAFVGPLTNLAIALSLEPRLTDWVLELVIMGGAFYGPGNTTPSAEFNIFADPEAAAAVARSRLPQTWIGLDVTHQALLNHSQWVELAELSGVTHILVRETARHTFERRGRPHAVLHDPLAIAVVEQPDLVTCATGAVWVEVGEHRRGETRLVQPVDANPAAKVATGIDRARFAESFGRLIT